MRWRWIRREPRDKEKNVVKVTIEEVDDRDELCSFCQQRYELHALDLDTYAVRTLCDGRHIRP